MATTSAVRDDTGAARRAFPASLTGEVLFRRLLEKLPAGAYTCDVAGLITYCNAAAEQVWGRAPAINDPSDRFCGSFRRYATDGTPITHADCWMALALRDQRDYIGEEIMIERPDGRRLTALVQPLRIAERPERRLTVA